MFRTWTRQTILTKNQRDAFYKSYTWQKCRSTILERDDYLCQVCLRDKGEPTPADTVHHILHLKDRPDLALEESNLMSVCFDCHNDLHPEKGFGVKKVINKPENIKTVEINTNPEGIW